MVRETCNKIISKRVPATHKGDYGHVLVVAGSIGMTGAAYLCSQASLICGCGLVSLAIPASLNLIMEVKLTEVITKPQEETIEGSLSLGAYEPILKLAAGCDVIAIGCGLSTNPQVQELVKKLIASVKIPVVLDADGLNAVAGTPDVLKEIKSKVVITPHPGEMSRLAKIQTDAVQAERLKIAKNFAAEYNVIVTLKGHNTVVAGEDGLSFVNSIGNPGMATAGMGDVLTGMIASFIAQGLEPFDAAKLGVYLHSLSGDIAASKKGQISLIASDILEHIPDAIRKI
ncbi:MAG: NAD(P)H-hydrate dehydratase [Candidatus Omnitrophica bacterium]|nr:NAD(P)H-hydrate dehydratase [Candidatus Omnitrophota bacterium]